MSKKEELQRDLRNQHSDEDELASEELDAVVGGAAQPTFPQPDDQALLIDAPAFLPGDQAMLDVIDFVGNKK